MQTRSSPSNRNGPKTGLPFITNFGPTDYNATPNNYTITQLKNGLVYVANKDGILEYDGAEWRIIPTAPGSFVRSVGNVNETIYVGAQEDFGYLAPDSLGRLKFVSLKQYVPEPFHDFKGIWEILNINDTVYFRSYFAIFRWANGQLTAWKPDFMFHNAYVASNKFYVREVKAGLKILQGDSLKLVPDGELFLREAIAAILPIEGNRQLLISRFQGWFIFDGQSITHFSNAFR